ncbi:MAG: acyl--CoA ligase [Mogibacterium sp.]|nr:acyl--CoA ligase [Mogibacterium sp.]
MGGTGRKKLEKRIKDGSINEQSIWRYIREKNSAEPYMLCRTAVIDCTREYTYGQMFTEWEHYARAFSALGMTGSNGSRVAVAGTVSAEPLFSFYGLNMTGAEVSMFSYPDFLPGGMWKTMAEKERITDLIISDIMVSPDTWPDIKKTADELGMRNVILVHSKLGGPSTGPAELVYNEFNYHALRRLPDTVFMDDMIRRYAAAPISYGAGDPDHLALITHTSGTTKGTRKPLPYKERSVNTVATNYTGGFHSMLYGTKHTGQVRITPSFDFSSFLCMCGVVNAYFSEGQTVVLTFFGFMHPKFVRAVGYYGINVLFTSGFMIDSWMDRTDTGDIDFSPVIVFGCGGSYMPPDKVRKYTEFIKSRGFRGEIIRGYGMSETGGAELYVPPGCMDDILGYPVNADDYRILDSGDGRFYSPDEGPRTGVMYAASDSLCMNELDSETLFEFTEIDGRDFLCSNDLVRVNGDGSLSYAGRTDRYFVNNDGVRFEAGLVETEVSRQPGISMCAVVPVLDKRIHDTVPVLYVTADAGEDDPAETVRIALRNVFIEDGLMAKSILPSQFVLADDIPCNSNGKIDIYRITRDRLKGEAYNVGIVSEGGAAADISCEPAERTESIKAGALPEGMGAGSALGLFELFNS